MSFSAASWSALALWGAVGVLRSGVDLAGWVSAPPLAVPVTTVCRCHCDTSSSSSDECPAVDCSVSDGGGELPRSSWLNDLVAAAQGAATGAAIGGCVVAWACCRGARGAAPQLQHEAAARPQRLGTEGAIARARSARGALAHLAVDASTL